MGKLLNLGFDDTQDVAAKALGLCGEKYAHLMELYEAKRTDEMPPDLVERNRHTEIIEFLLNWNFIEADSPEEIVKGSFLLGMLAGQTLSIPSAEFLRTGGASGLKVDCDCPACTLRKRLENCETPTADEMMKFIQLQKDRSAAGNGGFIALNLGKKEDRQKVRELFDILKLKKIELPEDLLKKLDELDSEDKNS